MRYEPAWRLTFSSSTGERVVVAQLHCDGFCLRHDVRVSPYPRGCNQEALVQLDNASCGGGTMLALVLDIWTRAFKVALGNAAYLSGYALGRDRIRVDAGDDRQANCWVPGLPPE